MVVQEGNDVGLGGDTCARPECGDCPCGGTAQVSSPPLIRRFPRRFRGLATVTGSVTVQCLDQSGDPCPITCSVTVTVNITGNPGNSCAQSLVTVVRVQTTCQPA